MCRIKHKLIFLFLTIIIVSWSKISFSQDWSSEQKEVWEISKKMEDFWANRDLDGYMSCLHKNFIGWFQKDPLPIDKNSLRNWERHWLSTAKIHHWESKPVSINITDDTAIINFYQTIIREDENGKKLIYSKWTEILKKENGKWLILGMHGGIILEN